MPFIPRSTRHKFQFFAPPSTGPRSRYGSKGIGNWKEFCIFPSVRAIAIYLRKGLRSSDKIKLFPFVLFIHDSNSVNVYLSITSGGICRIGGNVSRVPRQVSPSLQGLACSQGRYNQGKSVGLVIYISTFFFLRTKLCSIGSASRGKNPVEDQNVVGDSRDKWKRDPDVQRYVQPLITGRYRLTYLLQPF